MQMSNRLFVVDMALKRNLYADRCFMLVRDTDNKQRWLSLYVSH